MWLMASITLLVGRRLHLGHRLKHFLLLNIKNMKTLSFPTILTCMMCMFYISCENAGIQDSIKGNAEISYREIDDCEDCPAQHCCCTIEIDEGGGNAFLDICGVYTNETVSNPCGPFSPESPCSTIDEGANSPINLLLLTNPRDYFCLPFDGSFRIYNRGTLTANLKMTCQADNPTNPIYTYFRLDSAEAKYFHELLDCELEECEE